MHQNIAFKSKILGSNEMYYIIVQYIYYLFVADLDNLNKILEKVLVPGDVCVDTCCQTKGSFAGALLGIGCGCCYQGSRLLVPGTLCSE